MKKLIGFALLSLSLNSWAAPREMKASKAEENAMMARLTEQIFSSIDQSSIDLNINGISYDSAAAEGKQVRMDDVQLNGMISFAANWQADLIEPDADADQQMQKVYPKLVIDANKLKLAVDLKMLANSETIQLKFFSHYDSKAKAWVARPLTLKASNQMNKDLLTIRLHSLNDERKVNAQNPNQQDISGTCVSDKVLLDMTTGKNKTVQVDCRFSGIMTDKGYKFQFRYANK